MMTFKMITGLCALMMLGTPAMAKDFDPPPSGSVCEAAIASYLGKQGTLQRGVVRISTNIERDGTLHFGFYGDVKKVDGVMLAELEPISGAERVIRQLYDWSHDNGMWLVATTSEGEYYKAQVFVSGVYKKKRACLPLYDNVQDYEPSSLPYDILD